MTPLLRLTAQSAWNRRASLALAIVAMALSVMLLLGVERLRDEARVGRKHAAENVHERGLARAVFAQESVHAAFFHADGHVIQGFEFAENLGYTVYFK